MALKLFWKSLREKKIEQGLDNPDRFARGVLDALTSNIAILDENGFVLKTGVLRNHGAEVGGQNNGGPAASRGINNQPAVRPASEPANPCRCCGGLPHQSRRCAVLLPGRSPRKSLGVWRWQNVDVRCTKRRNVAPRI